MIFLDPNVRKRAASKLKFGLHHPHCSTTKNRKFLTDVNITLLKFLKVSMKKKIVIHDVGNAWMYRTQTWLYNEVTQLGEEWDSWAVTHRIENWSEFPYDKVFSLKNDYNNRYLVEKILKKMGIVKQCPTIHHFIKKMQPDIIHSHFGNNGWANLGLAKSIGAKHVVSFYGMDVNYLPTKKRWINRYSQLFNQVDAVLCEGPHMGSKLEQLGCPSSKIKIYPLGIDLQKIIFKQSSWRPNNPLRILMAASFVEKKGLPYALEAIGQLIHERSDIDIQVTIIGAVSKSKGSRQEFKKINKVIDQQNIRHYLAFKGYCDHKTLGQSATEHDVFMSPSVTAAHGDTEGGAPVTIIEMAAAGLPIISTTHCDIPFVLGESNRKLLVAEREISSLFRVMSWLVDHPDEWNKIALENRQHIESKFDIRHQGPALADIYNRLVP